MKWLKTKFYPVDYERKIIYNDPQPRERDCSYGKYDVMKDGTIGTKGSHFIEYEKRYSSFEVKPPKDAKPYQPVIYIGDDAGEFARKKSIYGRKSWLVWTAKDGRRCAARHAPETLKMAMLATGTQNHFLLYGGGESVAMRVWWGLACMWLRHAKAGIYVHFD